MAHLCTRRRDSVDEIEPPLDTIQSAIDIVEPLLNAGVIHLEAGDLSLERTEPCYDLIQFAINAVEMVVEVRVNRARRKSRTLSDSLISSFQTLHYFGLGCPARQKR